MNTFRSGLQRGLSQEMKTLIVYYSFSGNNELLAKELQTKVNCDMIKIHELKERNGLTILLDILFCRTPEVVKPKISLAQYERVIFLAPIWAGKIANPMRAFIQMEKGSIHAYSFISLCGDGGNKRVSLELTRIAGKRPLVVFELRISDLLKMKNKRKFTSSYRVTEGDLEFFQGSINRFLHVQSIRHSMQTNQQ